MASGTARSEIYVGAIARAKLIHSIDLGGPANRTIPGLLKTNLLSANFAQRHIGLFGIRAGADIKQAGHFLLYFIDM